jgi:HAD superfamily hydrolase (TIGR01459 family)
MVMRDEPPESRGWTNPLDPLLTHPPRAATGPAMTQLIDSLGGIADRYDVLLCDVWGVIHNGMDSFPEACSALARWRSERGPVVLISNSPRPSAEVIQQMDELGVPLTAWSAIVTSGDATRELLADRAPGPAWRIGPDRDAPLYEGLGLTFADADAAEFISCTGPFDDEVETPEHYRAAFEKAVARRLVMICANPDKMVQRGDRLIYCGGALADLYKDLGGAVLMAGKPYVPIYGLALAKAEQALGARLDIGRVLAIGDGIATDVLGANINHLEVLFVASGVHGGETPRLDPAAVDALLARHGAWAGFAMAHLIW